MCIGNEDYTHCGIGAKVAVATTPAERAQQRSVATIRPDSAAVPTAKDDQMLTQDDVFCCEPPTRLERKQQNQHQKPEAEDHTLDVNEVYRPMQKPNQVFGRHNVPLRSLS
jgi:hypothetical protein